MSKELLEQILANQEIIIQEIQSMKKSQSKLDDHIDFIEQVYEDLSYPLSFLPNYIKVKGTLTQWLEMD